MQDKTPSLAPTSSARPELRPDDAQRADDSPERAQTLLFSALAAALAHDLNNAFQAVLGPLWELEELTEGMPAAAPHLLRLHEACKQGMALVRLQNESFAALSAGGAKAAALIEDCQPLSRHLLGVTHVLRINIAPTALALTVNQRVFRRLLLHLCMSFGRRIQSAAIIELSLGPAPSPQPELPLPAAVTTAGQPTCLSIVARPRAAAPAAQSGQPGTAPSVTFTANELQLANQLGATLRAHSQGSLLTFELQFKSPPSAAVAAQAST
jgi:hypothetical protein